MTTISYDRRGIVRDDTSRILTENGYIDISSSPFLGQIVSSITSAVEANFDKVYDIADNIDISRSEGSYLDRWGKFFNEPRSMLSYARDLSLTNTYIYITPENKVAGDITSNGTGFSIPSGTSISTEDGTVEFETIDPVYMKSDRSKVYCRTMAKEPGPIYLLAGQLTQVSINLSDIAEIIPSITSTYGLSANNTFPISESEQLADDLTYKYILQEKSNSIGLFNESTINTTMDVTEIVNLSMQKYIGGVNVYIETRRPDMADIIVEIARMGLRNKRLLGSSVNAYPPIYSSLKVSVQLEMEREDNEGTTQSNFKTAIYETIISQAMGSSIDLTQICNDIKVDFPNIIGVRVKTAAINSRTMINYIIAQQFNEKILITEDDISILA